MATREQILDALGSVIDPELRRPVTELGHGARHRDRRRPTSRVTIALTVVGCPLRSSFEDQVAEHVGSLPGVESVESALRRDDARRARCADDAAARRRPRRAASSCSPTTRVLAVASGKGGVGKSSLTRQPRRGARRARAGGRDPRRRHLRPLDPAHARHLPEAGRRRQDDRAARRARPAADVDRLLPRRQPAGDVARADAAPRARAVPAGRPLGRRSTCCVVDMPPGTGDVSISLGQLLPRAEAIVVTTPQPLAQEVASRAATMAQKTGMRVVGVVENMTSEVFGVRRRRPARRGARRAAARQRATRRAPARVRRRGHAARHRRARRRGGAGDLELAKVIDASRVGGFTRTLPLVG